MHVKKNYKPSNRGDRIAATVQKYVDQILRTRYVDDALLAGVSVVGVESSGGGQFVKLFYYAGLAALKGYTLDAVKRRLDAVTPEIRTQLAGIMNQKCVADIRFVYDDTLDKAERLDHILDSMEK